MIHKVLNNDIKNIFKYLKYYYLKILVLHLYLIFIMYRIFIT
jgi:hypothetical protein